MASFNVLTEPWIPVMDLDGNKFQLGILEVLKKAHRLKGIYDASPMVEYGVHRLLSLFMTDALRPADIYVLNDLLDEGSFSEAAINAYVARCAEEGCSFDLFDAHRPFLQTQYKAEWDKERKSVANLDATASTGNNHAHFDHTHLNAHRFSFAEAARLLVPVQIFCTAGAQGYPSNVSAAPPYYTVVKGENLFQTLIYSMQVDDEINHISFDDPPVIWRNPNEIEPKRQVMQTSWLYGMLFPARRVLLIPEEDTVAEIYLSQGMNYVPKETWVDPFVTYREIKDGVAPWRPNSEKAVWRNLNDLLSQKGNHAPSVLRQYLRLEKECENANVTLYGVQTNQANYLGAFRFDLHIPTRLAKDDERLDQLTGCIRAAEELASGLKRSLANVAEIPEQTVSQTVQSYYDECETLFWEFCQDVLAAEDADPAQAYMAWIEQISRIAKNVRKASVESLRLHTHAMIAEAKGEKELYKTINKLREVK